LESEEAKIIEKYLRGRLEGLEKEKKELLKKGSGCSVEHRREMDFIQFEIVKVGIHTMPRTPLSDDDLWGLYNKEG